mmetsp:Transcript_15581/g.48229  ORF Transcript_15581/g.48229 Transcript_15581/m.48229 type:complete len:228 (+) Transcript_15581:316-999(+)
MLRGGSPGQPGRRDDENQRPGVLDDERSLTRRGSRSARCACKPRAGRGVVALDVINELVYECVLLARRLERDNDVLVERRALVDDDEAVQRGAHHLGAVVVHGDEQLVPARHGAEGRAGRGVPDVGVLHLGEEPHRPVVLHLDEGDEAGLAEVPNGHAHEALKHHAELEAAELFNGGDRRWGADSGCPRIEGRAQHRAAAAAQDVERRVPEEHGDAQKSKVGQNVAQ